MKILYITEENIGGGAKAILNLALSSSKFAEVAFLGCDRSFPKLKEVIVFNTKAKRTISLRYFWDFWISLNNLKPDIVHANGMYTGLIALLARSLKRRKYKVIMTLHHTSGRFRLDLVAKKLVPFLNKVDAIHYLTEYQREFYLKYGLITHKFNIIPNLTFSHTYAVGDVNTLRTKLLSDTSSEWLIVYAGRLIESKQVHVFIDVIKKINQHNINVGGIIVGAGDKLYTSTLHKISFELEISSKIVFTGFSAQPELYIKACDFCLFPTMHAEALPLFIIESFSQKKTLVVSNHPSVTNIVEDNVDSIVSINHASVAYAEKCIELIYHPQLLRKLETGAWHKYNNSYKEEKVINEFEKMYLEIMKN